MLNGALTGHIYEDGRLEVLGYIEHSRHGKIYLVHCKICAEDIEQYGDGNFKIYDSNILKGVVPCGCYKRYQLSDAQLTLRLQRVSAGNKIKFVKLAENLNGKRRAVFLCEEHGEYVTVYHNYLAGKGCRKCVKNNLKSDDVMIAGFRNSGVFSEDTSFTRSSKINSIGVKVYWDVVCGICSEAYTSTGQHLKQGKQGCSCSSKAIRYAYVLRVDDGCQSYIKFGISKNPTRRTREHLNGTNLDVSMIGVWEFPSSQTCKDAETEAKRVFECGVLDRNIWPDGWTETSFSYNLEPLCHLYQNYGGVKID